MATATFYLIQPDSPQSTESGFDEYVLFLLHHFCSQGVKLYLNCENKAEAHRWDEKLFALEGSQFIAHNLVGEGPKYGTPLEIGFDGLKPAFNRNLVINISNSETIFARSQSQVIDFVPCAESQKNSARKRFASYRKSGFEMQTIKIEPNSGQTA